jgi:hypothetical protein
MTFQTRFGSLADYQKGRVDVIDDDPKNYVFSNVFEVASRSKPWERVAVAKNFEYVIEAARASGESPYWAARHDEFVVCMDGELEVELHKLNEPARVIADRDGAHRLAALPPSRPMGRIVLGRGHMALLPKQCAYRFRAGAPAALMIQTIEGPETVFRWAEICQTAEAERDRLPTERNRALSNPRNTSPAQHGNPATMPLQTHFDNGPTDTDTGYRAFRAGGFAFRRDRYFAYVAHGDVDPTGADPRPAGKAVGGPTPRDSASRIDHVLGRRDFESPPRAWEITMLARRLAGVPAPPIGAYLAWGFAALEMEVCTTADRDAAATQIQDFVGALQVPRRVAEMFAELGHELLMNAMYDAPVDGHGRPRYAGNRKADIVLAEHERPAVRIATDGTRLALQIRDPFGRLERHHVFDGLARGLAGGEMDTRHGGAGLGMMVCHNASSAMIFDVARGRHTEVTALFELDMNLREFRTQAKSLQFWSR